MNRRMASSLLLGVFGMAIGVTGPDTRVAAQNADPLVMIVNKANSATVGMGKTSVKKLLLGETARWPDGQSVTIVLRPVGSDERAALLNEICGMSEAEFTRHNLQAQFMGQTIASLHQERSPAALKNFVKSNSGAVGFLHRSEADESVKIAWVVQ